MLTPTAPSTLADVATVRPEEALALLADIATTVAVWHDAGRGHGAIDPGHIRLATPTEPAHLLDWHDDVDDPARIDDDVRQFGLLLEYIGARLESSGRSRARADRVRMQLDALASHVGDPDPMRRLTMREIARSLTALQRPHRPPRRPPHVPRRPAVVAIGALAAAALAIAGTTALPADVGESDRSRTSPTIAATTSIGAETRGSATPTTAASTPHIERDARRYEAGVAGDLLVDLEPTCDGGPVAVLLSGRGGDVITFPRWPHDADGVSGTTIGRVDGALGAVLQPGCRTLAVLRDPGNPVTLTIGTQP